MGLGGGEEACGRDGRPHGTRQGREGPQAAPGGRRLREDRLEFDTIDQLRDDLRTRLGEMKAREATAAVRDRVLDAMIDSIDVDIPEHADRRRDRAPRRPRRRARAAGRLSPTTCSTPRVGRVPARRTHGTMRSARSRPTWRSKASRGPRRSRSRPTSWAPRSPPLQRHTAVTRRSSAKQLERSGQIVTLAGEYHQGKALDLLVECADIEPDHRKEADGTAEAETATTISERDRDLRRHFEEKP